MVSMGRVGRMLICKRSRAEFEGLLLDLRDIEGLKEDVVIMQSPSPNGEESSFQK
jgi:hypothetical protein